MQTHDDEALALLRQLIREKKQQILSIRQQMNETTDHKQLLRLEAQLELVMEDARKLLDRTEAILQNRSS